MDLAYSELVEERGDRSQEQEVPIVPIRELLSYRLSGTANVISRSAAARFKQDFNISLGEWRTLALLGTEPDLSLNELARAANLDKGQMSRVVSGLIERGLVSREMSDAGGRTIKLSLTRSGQSTYRKLIRIASERNAAFLACLTPQELKHLYSALGKLGTLARAMLHASRSQAKGGRGT